MKRLLVIAGLAVLLSAPIASAGSWLQPRGDAAATGFQPEEGPEWKDVALEVELGVDGLSIAPPLILEDQVIVEAVAYDDQDEDVIEEVSVLSVDPNRHQVTTLLETEIPPGIDLSLRSYASDGDTLYASVARTVHAIPLTSAGQQWTWEWPSNIPSSSDDPAGDWAGCFSINVERGHVTVACWDLTAYGTGGSTQAQSSTARTLVARLDTATGDPAWTWQYPPSPNDPTAVGEGPPADGSLPYGLAISPSHVVVQTIDWIGEDHDLIGPADLGGTQETWQGWISVWALDRQDGALAWNWTSQEESFVCAELVAPVDRACVNEGRWSLGNPAVQDGAVYIKAQEAVRKLNLGTGEELWGQPIGEEDLDPNAGVGSAVALAEGRLFTTSAQTLYAMDTEDPEDGWSRSPELSPDGGIWGDVVVTPSTVYLESDQPELLHAHDVDRGEVRWVQEGSFLGSASVGHGMLAYTDHRWEDDRSLDPATASPSLILLGRTEASPTPVANDPTAYPDPGEPVEVDLSASEAGLQGPVTRYKAIWGDGNETAWQSDPVLTHTYAEPGDIEARFIVGNEANQTASTTQTFHVGQQAPTEPNWLSERFAPENQDMTFGVLGIALALGGGVVGVARRYRERSRLQEELSAIEQLFEETRDRPAECEAQLTERKAHARGLLTDGHLTEEQFQVVENRIEELKRELRMRAVDEEFAFLPYSLVTALGEMLEDGRVTAMEKDGFLAALEEDEMIHPDQKAVVRERIEGWFARDA